MKKLILLSILICLSACSSLELQAVTSSEEETQRILALGLSYEENLIEASKLSDPHMVKVVSLQLANARDDKIQAEIDIIASENISNNVSVSDNGLNFIGPKVSKSLTSILNPNPDQINYYLKGSKNPTTGIISHKLILSFVYESKNKRNYISANLCDQWSRCNGDNLKANNVSTTASKCSSSSCTYNEIIELNMNDELLRDYGNIGVALRFNSKKKSSKIELSKPYLTGYLKIAR
jgi:hypothetical protein